TLPDHDRRDVEGLAHRCLGGVLPSFELRGDVEDRDPSNHVREPTQGAGREPRRVRRPKKCRAHLWNDPFRYPPPVRAIRRFTVRPVLPEPLHPLGELVGNLRWSWHPPTQDLFEAVDPELWEASGHDPVGLLGRVPSARMNELAGDRAFLERLGTARAELEAYMTEDRWYQTLGEAAPAAIGYFSPEYGIT